MKRRTPAANSDPKQRPLYLNNLDRPANDPIITLERLESGLEEAIKAIEGCIVLADNIDDTHGLNNGPKYLLDLALRHAESVILAVIPYEPLPDLDESDMVKRLLADNERLHIKNERLRVKNKRRGKAIINLVHKGVCECPDWLPLCTLPKEIEPPGPDCFRCCLKAYMRLAAEQEPANEAPQEDTAPLRQIVPDGFMPESTT